MNDKLKLTDEQEEGRHGKHPLHSDLLEVVEIIEPKALFDVVTMGRLILACQDNDSIDVFREDWAATPQRIKDAIHYALDRHPLISSSKFSDNGNE